MNEENWMKRYAELESKISKVFNSISDKIPTKSVKTIELVIITLLKRVNNNYYAIHLLIENKLYLEAIMIIRSVIESTFVFNGLMDMPEETYDKLFKLSISNKKELYKKALNNQCFKKKPEKYYFEDLESQYISIKDLSKQSKKNEVLYNIAYKLVSDEVHINLNSLNKLIVMNKEKKFLIKENLDIQEFEEAYYTLEYCMFMIEQGLNNKYSLGMDNELLEIEKLLEDK